jgi:pimeloyl-ACP methyl ester carboxylesterase
MACETVDLNGFCSMKRHTLRRGRRIAFVAALTLCLTPALWNVVATQWRLWRTMPPGEFYLVDGREMYIYCVGSGTPTLVIESGLSSDSLGWYGVQRDLGRTTRVCAYDRSGLGLSEPRPGPRNAEAIGQQLHALLTLAGVQQPLVLVGWSAGGLYAREFLRQFPEEVVALVLIESSTPRQLERMPGYREDYEAEKRLRPAESRWERLRVWTGWERLMGRCSNGPSKELLTLPGEELARLVSLYVAKTCRPAYVGGELGELMAFESTAAQAGRLTSIGDRPLLVVTMDTASPQRRQTAKEIVETDVWSQEQESLKSLSQASWLVVAVAPAMRCITIGPTCC